MAKNITPENGTRAVDLLKTRGSQMFIRSSKSRMEVIDLITREMGMTVNKTTCLTGLQGGVVEREIDRMAKDLKVSKASGPLGVYKVERVTDVMDGEVLTRFYGLTALINSFNHECMNCLNADCEHRDKKFPVQEVQKRFAE